MLSCYLASTRSCHAGFRLLVTLWVMLFFVSGCQTTPGGDKGKSFSVDKGGEKLTISEKLEPPIKYFSIEKTMSATELREQAKGIAEQTGTAIGKSKLLTKDGPLTLVYKDLISMPDSAVTAKIGFPIKGFMKVAGQYKLESKPEFKCLSLEHSSNREDPKGNWLLLYDVAKTKGFQVNGEARTVVTVGTTGIKEELQLGIL